MNHKHHQKSILFIAVIAGIFITPLTAAGQQKLDDSELLLRGKDAYDRLPANLGLEDAPTFSEAVQYLFAYEQRSYREGRNPGSDLMVAMNWLYEGLENFKIGKADDANGRRRNDDQLRTKGLSAFGDAKNSVANGKVWDIEAFISASANLYAYLQVASSPRAEARGAFNWLQANRGNLIESGGKGDQFVNPASWVPSTPKPGTSPAFEPMIVEMQLLTPELKQIEVEVENDDNKTDARQEMTDRLNQKHDPSKQELEYAILKSRYKELKAELDSVKSRMDALREQGVGKESIEDEETDSTYDVVLTDAGENRIAVIKAVRTLTGLGLKDSKDLVDQVPSVIGQAVTKEKAREIQFMLIKAGAKVELRTGSKD